MITIVVPKYEKNKHQMVTLSGLGLNESVFAHFLAYPFEIAVGYMDVTRMENVHPHKSCIVLLANL